MASICVMRHVFIFATIIACFGLVQPLELSRVRRTLECGKNETLSMCGPCDNRCPLRSGKRVQQTQRHCPTQCASKQPACRCKDGYYRFNNLCLLEADCPNQCPKNEKNATCAFATSCQPTCSKPQGGNATEAGGFNICSWQVCDVPTCVCNDGFIRDDKTLQCITIDECPATGSSGAKKRLAFSLN